MKDINPILRIATANGQFCFEATADRKIGPQPMGFSAGDKTIYVLFGIGEIADPKEHRSGPVENDRQRHRMVHAFGVLDYLVCALHGLSRISLQPQVPGERNPRPIITIKSEVDRRNALRARRLLERCLKFNAGALKVAHVMERNPRQAMG